MKENEELNLLRFRYGRATEMLIAYNTFLYRQVMSVVKIVAKQMKLLPK